MAFTRLGTDLWNWRPFLACSLEAQRFWLAFYTCSETRVYAVGIFSGGPAALAEAVRMPFGEAHEALEELVERRLVEHDPNHRIVRLTELPDNGERPHNGSALKRWWTGFQMIPRCPTRDRHVGLIRWLVGKMTADHERAWEQTFGTVESGSTTYDTVYFSDVSSPQSDLFHSGDLGHRVGHGVGHVQGSGSGSGQGSGSGEGEHERESPLFAAGTGVGRPPGERMGPIAVPRSAFTASAMLEAISAAAGPRWHGGLVDDRLNPALTAVAHQCASKGVTLADLDLAGRYLRAGGLAYRNDLGASWAARPGSVLDLVAAARDWEAGDVELEDNGPAKVYPASAFGSGRREL